MAHELREAEHVAVVLTHGHADHAGCARSLAAALGAEILGPASVDGVDRGIADGDAVQTDEGVLLAVHTPGHTREHLSFHWPDRKALFAGDHVLGKGDTTWVGAYSGCVSDYLASLARLRALELRVIYPAHGPPLDDPTDALNRFEKHRRDRIRQVRDVLRERPDAVLEDLMEAVYGTTLPSAVRRSAELSLAALLDYARTVPE